MFSRKVLLSAIIFLTVLAFAVRSCITWTADAALDSPEAKEAQALYAQASGQTEYLTEVYTNRILARTDRSDNPSVTVSLDLDEAAGNAMDSLGYTATLKLSESRKVEIKGIVLKQGTAYRHRETDSSETTTRSVEVGL